MDYYCLIVHFESALVVPFLEELVALVLPIVSCVFVVYGLRFGFLLLLLILFWSIVPRATLIVLIIMLLGLWLWVHKTMIQKVSELVEDVFLSQLTVLLARSAWLLVEAKHCEGVEAEEHFMTDLRVIMWY